MKILQVGIAGTPPSSHAKPASFKAIEVHGMAVLADLEAALGHCFARPELLVCALTHRSLAIEQALENGVGGAAGAGGNERLEFLGDAVLGLVVGEALFLAHPEWQEGELTRVRAYLVSRKHMAEVARAFGLGAHVRLSRGEERAGLRSKSAVLSNTMEAVLGALFLDGGIEPVRALARRWVKGEAAEQLAKGQRSWAALGNYKAALQEHMQAAGSGAPVYRVRGESGPGNRKRFLVEVRLKPVAYEPEKTLARGTGSSKKEAEQDAARRALEMLAGAADGSGAGQAEDQAEE